MDITRMQKLAGIPHNKKDFLVEYLREQMDLRLSDHLTQEQVSALMKDVHDEVSKLAHNRPNDTFSALDEIRDRLAKKHNIDPDDVKKALMTYAMMKAGVPGEIMPPKGNMH